MVEENGVSELVKTLNYFARIFFFLEFLHNDNMHRIGGWINYLSEQFQSTLKNSNIYDKVTFFYSETQFSHSLVGFICCISIFPYWARAPGSLACNNMRNGTKTKAKTMSQTMQNSIKILK